jgi:enediyne polyketide synthase
MQIAVVGIACRYPGANSARELIENILAGRRYFREIPPERWKLEDYYDPDRTQPDKTYCKQAAVLEGFEFNASAFRIPQSTYRATDLAQWLALTVAKEALEDAQITDPPRAQTAVILGNTLAGETSRAHLVRYRWPYARRVFAELLSTLKVEPEQREAVLARIEERYKQPFPPVNEDNLAGGLANTIAGRICNYFDFNGGGYTVDGACSSSLLSIQEAAIGLEQGLCELVLAGGVDMSLDPFELVGFAKVGALSDSDIRVYDQRASGFLPGEGCGVVVLKRLADALRDGNRIYTVIRGVGYSSDGRGGITAPSVAGQSLAVDRAYSMTDYSFADVELIEGHGTGTPVGDRVELQTFIDAKRRHGASEGHRCGIGSIKSIIGHTKAAAGVAGFIKAALATYYRVLPPTMGLEFPNELFKQTPHVYPLMQGRRWRATRHRAAVSSAGFGGINTHITVEAHAASYDARARALDVDYLLQSNQNAELLVLAAETPTDLQAKIADLLPVARAISRAELADLAGECARRNPGGAVRLAIVADSPAALYEKLQRADAQLGANPERGDMDWSDPAAGIFLRRPKHAPRIAFLFPGQGSQYLDMGRPLRERYSFVNSHWTVCDQALSGMLPKRLSELIFVDALQTDATVADASAQALRRTDIAQPAIVAASMAMVEVLRYLGIEPEAVIGHSLGEYTALWCANGIDKPDVLRLVARRGAAMNAAGAQLGGMMSVAASPARVAELIADISGYVRIANYNAPTQTVVSGDRASLDALAELCAVSEIPASMLEVSGAFHSALMKNAQGTMSGVLRELWLAPLSAIMISPTTGDIVPRAQDAPELLIRQIVEPVRFTDAIARARDEGIDTFIEVGPGSVLLGLARRCLEGDTALLLGTDPGKRRDWSGFLQTVGCMYAAGMPVVPTRLFENRFVRPFELPYRPRFITSPCELGVEPLALSSSSLELARVSPAELAVAARPSPGKAARALPTDEDGDLFAFMKRVIMERFGYPAELVTPTARLLEDLNLDSIKSAEVIGEAMARVEVRGDPAQYGKLPLGEIAARLSGKEASATPAAPTPAPVGDTWVRAFEPRLMPEVLPATQSVRYSGRVLLISMPADALANAIAAQLQEFGFEVDAWRYGQGAPSGGPITGCIVLIPAGEREASSAGEPLSSIARAAGMLPEYLLDAAQAAAKRFVPAKTNGSGDSSELTRFFAAVTRSGSLLGHSRAPARWDAGPASAAFLKSWSLENPLVAVRMLDVDPDTSPSAVAERLLDELSIRGSYAEAGYAKSGHRFIVEWIPSASSLLSERRSLGPEEVWLVTGGAKGITAECVKGLVARSPARVALFGSSAFANKGDSLKSEAQRTLEALSVAGITARYYQCDVTVPEQVASCVARVRQELGTIKGLIHAAGVNVPHRVETVSKPAFRAVLAPKLTGLINLLHAIDPAALEQLVVFSSIIGVSGMPGNTDYAYANAWMGLVLKRLASAYPELQCREFAFTVWDEVGMGARLGSVTSLRRQGIEPIPAAEGVRRFFDLVHRQWRTPELVISARAPVMSTLRYADVAAGDLPFAQQVLAYQPGVELVCETTLDPSNAPYITDHNYNGTLLFPAVVGIEAMAQVALRCMRVMLSDARPPALENLRFARPIVVPAEGRRVRIYAQAQEPHPDGSLRVHVEIRSSLADYDAESFSADCVWRDAPLPAAPKVNTDWPEPLSIRPEEGLYGTLLFQGPTFRHVAAFLDVSSTHCVALIRAPESFGPQELLDGPMLGPAAIRDCFLHAIQVCVPQYRILPIGIDSLVTTGLRCSSVYLLATERMRTDKEFLYDMDVVSERGELVEQIRGYRCRIVDRYDDASTLDIVAQLHEEARARSEPAPAVAVH